MKISVAIVTRNRSSVLERCLKSLLNQNPIPFEIVIVDNASSDDTKLLIKKYNKILPIKYFYEEKIGIPFARNVSIAKSKGEVIAFIDDDCVADPNWILEIDDFFETNTVAVGVIGKTFNMFPHNISSVIEYIYYIRWLHENVENTEKTSRVLSGSIVDFKNAVFISAFIKKFLFSEDAPYGDVGDEDVEIGMRMYYLNKNIYFNPNIRVQHQYSLTIKRLFVRNFWNGFSNQRLYKSYAINTKNIAHVSIYKFISPLLTESRNINTNQKILLLFFFILYPIFYRIGRIVFTINFNNRWAIPQR